MYQPTGNEINPLIPAIIIIIVVVLLFLLFRKIMLWYWKIDVIVKNQEEQTRILKKLNDNLTSNQEQE